MQQLPDQNWVACNCINTRSETCAALGWMFFANPLGCTSCAGLCSSVLLSTALWCSLHDYSQQWSKTPIQSPHQAHTPANNKKNIVKTKNQTNQRKGSKITKKTSNIIRKIKKSKAADHMWPATLPPPPTPSQGYMSSAALFLFWFVCYLRRFFIILLPFLWFVWFCWFYLWCFGLFF